MPGGWAYARVSSSAETVRDALPDIVGSNGARLSLKGGGEPVGPPNGSIRYRGRWALGRSSGEADLLLFPVSSGLCEVHVTLHSSGALPRPGARLARLANDLARAVAEAATPSTSRDTVRAERDTTTGRWAFVPATGSARSR